MEKKCLALYRLDNIIDFSFIEKFIIERYVRLNEYLQARFAVKKGYPTSNRNSLSDWFSDSNYTLYSDINTMMDKHVGNLYNSLIENKENESYQYMKDYFMYVIKFELSRLYDIKSNFNILGDDYVTPGYISNIAKVYNLDDDMIYQIIHDNINTHITSKFFINIIKEDSYTDYVTEFEKSIAKYDISDSLKERIRKSYIEEEYVKTKTNKS